MANPNIVNVTTIYGGTSVLAVGTTAANVVQNPAGSNQLYKVNHIMVTSACNITLSVTLEINRSGANTAIAKSINLPPSTTLILLGKDTATYLIEDSSLQISTTAAGQVTAVCSYEQIS